MNPESLFARSEHLERLSKDGDPLEVLDVTVDFEYFRGRLVEGLGYGDRLSWMRFFGFALGGRMPDENTIRHFRNRMTETGTLKAVMKAFDRQLHQNGYVPRLGQIIDATLVPAPKQRNSAPEREAIKAGKQAEEIWPQQPKHTAQANARKSSIRAAVEHVFGHQKCRFGLFIRTIGLARAEAKLILANLAYNFDRLIFHEPRSTIG